jgi:RNA polymerase sigma-70 factor (ECF subfamily)
MSLSEENLDRTAGEAKRFATTHWSVVLRAGDSGSPENQQALEQLCRAYWYPLYAFVRFSGHGPEEARDLTQEFFARLLEKKWLRDADPNRGRFRTFLLTALKRFLTNEWHRSQMLKRGGGRKIIELDGLEAEARYALEPANTVSPDALYERRWALLLIERVQARLAAEAAAGGGTEKFTALEPTLAGERTEVGYEALAAQFKTTAGTVKSWVVRLRRRFRDLLREEVQETLGPGEDVDDELRRLLGVVAGGEG